MGDLLTLIHNGSLMSTEQPSSNTPGPLQKHKRDPSAIVAKANKDTLRSLFHLLSGRPDSKVKLFHREVVITLEELTELNRKVTEKLGLHDTIGVNASATVKFDKQQSVEFGSVAELIDFDWNKPYKTKELTFRWDFLIQLPAFEVPQRHTLTVRVASPPSPQEFLRLMISQDPDEADELDGRLALCVARVDFISHRLADELIDIVEEWNTGLHESQDCAKWLKTVRKHSSKAMWVVNHVTPVAVLALSAAWMQYHTRQWTDRTSLQTEVIPSLGNWLLFSAFGVYVAVKLAGYLSSVCYRALHESSRYAVFMLTRGDAKRGEKLRQMNKQEVTKFILSASFAFVLNVSAGIFVWWLLP